MNRLSLRNNRENYASQITDELVDEFSWNLSTNYFSNSTGSSVMGDYPEALTFKWLFLKLNQFIYDR